MIASVKIRPKLTMGIQVVDFRTLETGMLEKFQKFLPLLSLILKNSRDIWPFAPLKLR